MREQIRAGNCARRPGTARAGGFCRTLADGGRPLQCWVWALAVGDGDSRHDDVRDDDGPARRSRARSSPKAFICTFAAGMAWAIPLPAFYVLNSLAGSKLSISTHRSGRARHGELGRPRDDGVDSHQLVLYDGHSASRLCPRGEPCRLCRRGRLHDRRLPTGDVPAGTGSQAFIPPGGCAWSQPSAASSSFIFGLFAFAG